MLDYIQVGTFVHLKQNRKDSILKKILVIGVSLLAACSVFAENANNAMLVPKLVAPQATTSSFKPRVRRVRILLTAYVPGKGKKTATGRDANLPGIAADFKLLPPGTKIFIPGRGTFVVDDTGGQMRIDAREKGIYHLDLRIPPPYHLHDHLTAQKIAYQEAYDIGKKWINVYIIG